MLAGVLVTLFFAWNGSQTFEDQEAKWYTVLRQHTSSTTCTYTPSDIKAMKVGSYICCSGDVFVYYTTMYTSITLGDPCSSRKVTISHNTWYFCVRNSYSTHHDKRCLKKLSSQHHFTHNHRQENSYEFSKLQCWACPQSPDALSIYLSQHYITIYSSWKETEKQG